MKKLLYLIITVAFVSTYGCDEEQDKNALTKDVVVNHGITLNNIDEVDAGRMRQRFLDLKDKDLDPDSKSFWISKEMLDKMVSLLEAEVEKDKKAKDPTEPDTLIKVTDGIRIYLGADLTSTKIPLNLSLLFVSTRDNGKDTSNTQSGRFHKDNYIHNIADPLFKLGRYEIPCLKGTCVGERLYGEVQDEDCNEPGPHGITIAKATEMVKQFDTPHVISTEGEWFDLGFWQALSKIPNISGVRIYLSQNPLDTDPKKSLKDAFVITATVASGSTHIDDFTCHHDIFKIYNELYQRRYGLPFFVQDNGELCPTHCD